jgi:hypothetical protein
MFRKISVLGVLLVVLSSGFVHAQTLDDAIKNAAGEICSISNGPATLSRQSFNK